MSGLILQLSGPMQSWGTRSHWDSRDTHTFPTRSALIGLVAAANGHLRHQPLDRYAALEFTIRIDRAGTTITDYHTVGGGRPPGQTPPQASGTRYRPKRRAEGQGTIVSLRDYLSDAAFTVAITASDANLIDDIDNALKAPTFGPHLGRRSCPPAGPLVLGRVGDPVGALTQAVPIARDKPHAQDHVSIDIITETTPEHADAVRSHTNPTNPIDFSEPRRYQPHTTWHTTHSIPAALCAGTGISYLNALLDYQSTMT